MKSIALAIGLLSWIFGPLGPPPMKTGLWEITDNVSITAPGSLPKQLPPTSFRACVNAFDWTASFGSFDQQSGCSPSNGQVSGRHYNFDLYCTNGSGHGVMDFDSANATSGHGMIHVETNPGAGATARDTVFSTRFVSSACE
jgi:hypothetical protein